MSGKRPSPGDTKKMPCGGSDQCRKKAYTIWVWTSGILSSWWECSICGKEKGNT